MKNPVHKPIHRGCDECENGMMPDGGQMLREKVWGQQLQGKQILITGDIKEDLIEKAVIQIFNFNNMDAENRLSIQERQPIVCYINTNGGSLDEAFSFVSAVEASETPVITVALGKAYSAGFLMLLAGHKRYAQKYSTLMYHQGSTGGIGEINRMMEYVKHWESCQSLVEDYVLSKTKIKKKKLDQIFSQKLDWYLKPQEAMQLGIIDGIWE